ncbi:GntR family transcriptional regulator, partial [Mesorhizobium sp. M7A.F.Ca.CA.004.06.1.1]
AGVIVDAKPQADIAEALARKGPELMVAS